MQTRSSDGKPGVTDGRDGLPACGVHAALLHDKPTDAPAKVLAARRTCGCAYSFDGSLEGLLSAIHAAIHAHDAQAEIVDSSCVQPRLGQELVDCATDIENATKVRRLIEYSLGAQAFRCIRAVASSDDEERGTAIYRFLAHAIPASGRTGCNTCARKASCTRACSSPAICPQLDDLAEPATFKLMSLYRSVMNERHYMVQFIRFEHCEGDVWFARCNPKASVVPLIMDWFIPRFNDQRFVIYDENHALSGVWDGRRWYLVAGSDITPPPRAGDERMMQAAWRRFYRSVSLDARYHPELRRSFMPMRLWRNLTEMQPE